MKSWETTMLQSWDFRWILWKQCLQVKIFMIAVNNLHPYRNPGWIHAFYILCCSIYFLSTIWLSDFTFTFTFTLLTNLAYHGFFFFFLDEIMPCPITNKEEYILTKEKNTFRKPHTWHIHPFNIYVVCTKCHAVFCWWKTWANSCTRKVIGVM